MPARNDRILRALRKFFHAMLERGVLLPPSQFEALFVSAAHSEQDIARTIAVARESLTATHRLAGIWANPVSLYTEERGDEESAGAFGSSRRSGSSLRSG